MYRETELRDPLHRYTPRIWLALVGASAFILSAAGIAQAAALTNSGTAILDAGDGSVVVSGNGVTNGCINWFNSGSPPPCPGSGGGTLSVEAGSTSPFTVGASGTIQDIAFNTPFPVVDFIAIGGLDFDLLDIVVNTGPTIGDCFSPDDTDPGVSCTPAGSPFTLINGLVDPKTGLVDTVSISFTVDAEGYTGSSGTNYNQANLYIGVFSTQQAVTNNNIQSILQVITGGGAVSAAWSATFAPFSEVPEPESFLLLGAGLTVIGLFKRNARPS
jgi:hypothetical protein